MGFSVTTAYVIFTVVLLSVGATAASQYWGSQEDLETARRAQARMLEERAGTSLEVSAATYDAGAQRYTVEVVNQGSSQLRVSDLTFLLDGTPTTAVESTDVDGDAATDLWLPGETLTVMLNPVAQAPQYFQLVTRNGASVTHQE